MGLTHKVCIPPVQEVVSEISHSTRISIYGRDHGLERCSSPIIPVAHTPFVIQRPSGCEHTLSILRHVACYLCLACGRHGPLQYQLYTFWGPKVLVCHAARTGSSVGINYERYFIIFHIIIVTYCYPRLLPERYFAMSSVPAPQVLPCITYPPRTVFMSSQFSGTACARVRYNLSSWISRWLQHGF